MDNLGSEVGQKMRCAVKAKLIELGSGGGYIDDELPDYVMIMVANKRSKQQMISDLSLFLGENTELFVTWLHEVLQKLQEVTLPSTAAGPKEGKRKNVNEDKINSKREKKDHKKDKKTKKPMDRNEEITTPPHTITDVFADHLLEKAKSTLPIDTSVVKKKEKIVLQSNKSHSSKSNSENNTPNEFDIPTITEMQENSNSSNNANNKNKREKDLAELAEIQKKIYQAKRQLKNFDEVDESEDEDFLNLKEDGDELDDFESKDTQPVITTNINKNKRIKSPVIFDKNSIQNVQSDIKNKTGSNKDNKRREPMIYMPPQRRNERNDMDFSLNRKNVDNKNNQKSNEKDNNNREDILKRKSVHERLGLKLSKVSDPPVRAASHHDNENSMNKLKKSKEKEIENHSPNRAGNSIDKSRLVSRVIVAATKPNISDSENEDDRSVNSIIKIKPRPNVSPRRQACKNLLLRAVAEAQRSTILRSETSKTGQKLSPENKKNHKLYSKSFRDRNRNEVVKRNKSNIVIEVNSKFVSNDKNRYQNQSRGDGDEYVPEPISDRGDSDNQDYVYVPRSINNDFDEEHDENLYNEYQNDDTELNKTQFVVTLNDKNDKYGKKYSNKLNEQKMQQNSKNKEPKSKLGPEKSNNTDKPDRLQILAKKIKDKKLAERNNTEKIITITKTTKEIKRKYEETREQETEEEEFEKSMTPPLEDFIEEVNNIENKRTPPKRKRISLTPTHKMNDLTINSHEKSSKSTEENRKVSIKKIEIVKKYDKIPELSAVPIKSNLKPKPKERCKFFPLCSNGECEFFHPSAPCKSFPNCKYFADKCLYIHPKCKFDLACQRNDCNYMHSVVLSAPQIAPPLSSHVVPVQNYKTITATPLPTMCKYYPNCSNTNCTFYHPKLCRFGKNCLNKIECNFYHHDIPNLKDKFKWVASNA